MEADRDPVLQAATLAVHAGRERSPGSPLAPQPVFASAYHAGGDWAYAREGNPTWSAFERAVAALETAGDAVAFSSGMAAAAALLGTVDPGERVVVAGSAHVEVRRLLAELGARAGIEIEVVDPTDPQDFTAALAGARLAWIDSISNPTLDVAPIKEIAAAARVGSTGLVVDATLATPIVQRPITLGAEAVLHSAGKYLGGHSDLLLGVVATRSARLAAALRAYRERAGATPGTMEAWLALRGLRTLALRVGRAQESARTLAARLATHPEVLDVRYPGFGDHGSPGPLSGPGAMVAFTVTGGAERAGALCDAVQLIVHSGSLGGVETLIERHARWHDEPSVPPALLRLAVGCENVDDLWRDLNLALARTARGRSRPVRRDGAPLAAV